MAEDSANKAYRFWLWIKNQVVQEVPEDIEICEYDCRKRQCHMGEWERCDRRLQKAAGELMPDCGDHLGAPAGRKKPPVTAGEDHAPVNEAS